jgi:hypothetical protein
LHASWYQDKEVTRIRRLLFDFDPIRPAKISSSDQEHQAALAFCESVKTELSTEAWPEPLFADSGNGAHLVYAVDLENTTDNEKMIENVLAGLLDRYANHTIIVDGKEKPCVRLNGVDIDIDQSVHNAGRVSKVYGTWARKGDSISDRPHRLAQIISVPDRPEPVPFELLKALAASGKAQISQKGSTGTPKPTGTATGKFDLAGYLDKYDVNVTQVKEHKGATLHVLDTCLFDETHTGGEAAIGQAEDGKLFYQCFHNSCNGKTWHDARQKISGDMKLQDFSGGAEKETQAKKLIQLAGDATLFHSPDDGRFAIVPQNRHREVWPIKGKGFRDWLNHRFYLDQRKPPGNQALQDAIRLLEAKARFEGEQHQTFTRIGEHGGNIFLDLCNSTWEAVEITAHGWRVIQNPPVMLRRTRGMLYLPKPVPGGSLVELKPFLNLPDDDGAFRLVAGFLVQALSPSGPYPILTLEGEQGTAKSTTARILRSLVDPATALLKTVPRDEHDLMIAASNSWLMAFDNLSGVQLWLSDALCRLSTGGGFATRELYTDAEETIFEATRPLLLTGIDRIASRHDMISRSIIITLPVIPGHKRQEEKDLWRGFEAARPRILGALCDAVSAALANLENTKLSQKPRMADFAKWVTAAESALPWEPGAFMEAYTGNCVDAINLALDSDVVACALRELMDNLSTWEGTATKLLEDLKQHVPEETRKHKSWPKAANSLSHRLRRASTFLRNTGIELDLDERGTDGKRTRNVTIKKGTQKTVQTVQIVRENQKNHTGQAFEAQTIRTVSDDTCTVSDGSDDTSDDTEKTSSDSKAAQGKVSDGSDGSDDKKPSYSKNAYVRVAI